MTTSLNASTAKAIDMNREKISSVDLNNQQQQQANPRWQTSPPPSIATHNEYFIIIIYHLFCSNRTVQM